ncbi:MAG: NUDIX hydrolase [Candidatus Omnitrophica bacterium]|nr:NUDIX hydrolase [Candidatus Omnitrophota bacterium]
MIRPWQKKSTEKLACYPVFDLRRDIMTSPRTGFDLPVYILETRNWVNIVPLTSDNQVVMVRQYRFASEEVTLEIPGGLIDANDGSMAEAARRELREETGYDSDRIHPLGACRPNPAIMTNLCYMFLAENVEKKFVQELDAGEDIQVELIPLDEISALISKGVIQHSLVLNAFYLLDIFRKSRPDGGA